MQVASIVSACLPHQLLLSQPSLSHPSLTVPLSLLLPTFWVSSVSFLPMLGIQTQYSVPAECIYPNHKTFSLALLKISFFTSHQR